MSKQNTQRTWCKINFFFRSKKDKSQAQEPEDFGEVKLETVTPMLGPDEHGSSRGTLNPLLKFLQAGREGHTRDYVMEHQAVSGAYMPKVGERFHAVEIPQNLVVPLRREADFREQFTGDPHPSNIGQPHQASQILEAWM